MFADCSMNKSFIFILFISLFISEFFFSICAILGINLYEDGAESSLFMLFSLFLDLCVFLLYCKTLIRKGLTSKDIKVCLVVLLVLICYFIESPQSESAETVIKSFLAKSIPAILIVLTICKERVFVCFFQFLDVLMFVVTIGLIANFRNYLQGSIGIGGGSYQALSYYAAFAYSINLVMQFVVAKEMRFSLFSTKLYMYLSILFLPIQICSCLIGGGRGAMVLLLMSSLYVAWLKRKEIIRWKYHISFILFLIVALIVRFVPAEYFELIEYGFDRSFSYLSESGIDMSDTSNRDIVYGNMVKAILDSPLTGYGIFKYLDLYNIWPHNILLEFLLQGGLILFTFSLLLFVRLFFLWKKINNQVFCKPLLAIIIMFSGVKLLFSGTYLIDPLFWYSITLLFIYQRNSFEKSYDMVNKLRVQLQKQI